MEYHINIAEIRSTSIKIEASSSAEAEQIAMEMYDRGEITVCDEPIIEVEDLDK